MSEQTYCIYKHTSPSGKSYIGQTMNYKQRVRAHKNLTANATIFASAIKKYGWENFTSEIIKDNLSLDDANTYEAFYIAEHNTLVPNGYNVAVGGLNSKPTNDTKDKIKATQLSRSADASEITRMYFDNPENIKKHSEIMKGKANTEKAREVYVSKGIASLPETKSAVSKGMKAFHTNNPGLLKEYYANNEIARKAISDKLKAFNEANPDSVVRNSERAKAQFSDPLNRIKCRLASAIGHAKKAGRPFSIISYQPEKVAA